MLRKQRMNVVFMGCMAAFSLGSHPPTYAQNARTVKPTATAVLLESPKEGDRVALMTWDHADPLSSTIQAESLLEGICVHCNIPMKFKAAQAAARCSVCL